MQCAKSSTKQSTWSLFLSDQRGVTAIEYALIGGFLVVALIGALPLITTGLNTGFGNIAGYLQ